MNDFITEWSLFWLLASIKPYASSSSLPPLCILRTVRPTLCPPSARELSVSLSHPWIITQIWRGDYKALVCHKSSSVAIGCPKERLKDFEGTPDSFWKHLEHWSESRIVCRSQVYWRKTCLFIRFGLQLVVWEAALDGERKENVD